MKNIIKTLLILISFHLSSCVEEDMEMNEKVISEQYQRFEVTRENVFRDDLAYENKRGIYIILDKETGKEYIGVIGIGISELGSHQVDKTRVKDER